MTIEEMRQELMGYCEPMHHCEDCNYYGNAFCDNYNMHVSDEGVIRDWYTYFFGAEPDPTPVIKDSGSRTEFSTGAVRDIQEGKGRCDLMPLDVVAWVLGGLDDPDHVLMGIATFMGTGQTEHLYYALEMFRNQLGIPTETMFLEVAKHFEEGAKKYQPDNWKKGIPLSRYVDSAVRHYLKYLRGDKDEPHDRAFCWNIICAIWTCKHKPELNDYRKENNYAED